MLYLGMAKDENEFKIYDQTFFDVRTHDSHHGSHKS